LILKLVDKQRQKAEGRRQKAGGRRQEAEGRRQNECLRPVSMTERSQGIKPLVNKVHRLPFRRSLNPFRNGT
jgi:hypothetical protein